MSKTNTNNKISNFTYNSAAIAVVFLLITLIFAIFISPFANAQSTPASTTSSTSSASTSSTPTPSPIPVTGIGTPGNTITVVFPDGTVVKTTVKNDGTWSIIPLKPQAPGKVTITETTPQGVQVGPTIIINYPNGDIATGAVAPTLTIKDPYVCPGKITGIVDNVKSIVNIEISKAGTTVLSIPVTLQPDGTWMVSVKDKLADGKYTAKYTATYGGNISSGLYDFNHKNNCEIVSSNSTVRTGGINLIASVLALSCMIIGLYFVLIKQLD